MINRFSKWIEAKTTDPVTLAVRNLVPFADQYPVLDAMYNLVVVSEANTEINKNELCHKLDSHPLLKDKGLYNTIVQLRSDNATPQLAGLRTLLHHIDPNLLAAIEQHLRENQISNEREQTDYYLKVLKARREQSHQYYKIVEQWMDYKEKFASDKESKINDKTRLLLRLKTLIGIANKQISTHPFGNETQKDINNNIAFNRDLWVLLFSTINAFNKWKRDNDLARSNIDNNLINATVEPKHTSPTLGDVIYSFFTTPTKGKFIGGTLGLAALGVVGFLTWPLSGGVLAGWLVGTGAATVGGMLIGNTIESFSSSSPPSDGDMPDGGIQPLDPQVEKEMLAAGAAESKRQSRDFRGLQAGGAHNAFSDNLEVIGDHAGQFRDGGKNTPSHRPTAGPGPGPAAQTSGGKAGGGLAGKAARLEEEAAANLRRKKT